MSIKRQMVSEYACDACQKKQPEKPENWAKFKLVGKDESVKTMDICSDCCYKIHKATGLSLLP